MSYRGEMFKVQTWFFVEECFKCHVLFGMPQDMQTLCREKGDPFFCPNGHEQVYTKPLLQEARIRADNAERRAKEADTRYRSACAERDHHSTERKKMRTRWRNIKQRVKNGVCPCCSRHFKNLERHMESKHPKYCQDHSKRGSTKGTEL